MHDLLDSAVIDKVTGKPSKEIRIREKNGNILIDNLKAEEVTSKAECIQLLNRGI